MNISSSSWGHDHEQVDAKAARSCNPSQPWIFQQGNRAEIRPDRRNGQNSPALDIRETKHSFQDRADDRVDPSTEVKSRLRIGRDVPAIRHRPRRLRSARLAQGSGRRRRSETNKTKNSQRATGQSLAARLRNQVDKQMVPVDFNSSFGV